MRFLLFAALLALSACATAPGPTEAQPANPANSAIIDPETCVAAAGPSRLARLACVGRATTACIEGDDSMSSTAGMVMCAGGERALWQALLDYAAAQLRARESDSQSALLDTALAERAAWLRARCGYEASIYEGGSLARYVGAACARDVVAEQAIDLYARLNDEP